MDKLTLMLALGAYLLGGYAAYAVIAGDDSKQTEQLEALQTEVTSLRDALAAHDRAIAGEPASHDTAGAGHRGAAARLKALETGRQEALAQVAEMVNGLSDRVALVERAGSRRASTLERLDKRLEGLRPSTPSDTLSVKSLEVRNGAGKVVVRLGMTPTGGGMIEVRNRMGKRAARLLVRSDNDGELRLYDDKDTMRTAIGGNDEGGYANFYSRAGDLAAYIGGDSGADAGYIAVFGKKEKKALELYSNEKGGIVAARNVVTDKRVATIGTAKDTGTGVCVMNAGNGKRGLFMFTSEDGGQLAIQNSSEKRVAFLGASSDPAGNGLLYVARKDGQRIGEIGVNDSKGGYLSVKNHNDKRIIFMGAATGESEGDGVLEVGRRSGKLGVVLRGYAGGSSVRVYDIAEKVKEQLR